MATVAEVQARVAQVKAAYSDAKTKAWATGIWTTDEEEKAQKALTAMGSSVEAWATRGNVAAASKADPAGGWSMWVKGGNDLLQAMSVAVDIGEVSTLGALSETVALIPKHAAGDVKVAASVAGDVVSSAAGGFLAKAWWVVGLAVAAAVGLVVFKSKMVR